MAARYWVVSLPVQNSASSIWTRLQKQISKHSFNTPHYILNIPNLHVGTLDSVLSLCDNLVKNLGVKLRKCVVEQLCGRSERQMKYRQRVLGLILISPLCKAPSWTEWLYNKEVHGSAQISELDTVQICRRSLEERQSSNVWWFLEAINGRPDNTEGLRKQQCRSLIFVGDNS